MARRAGTKHATIATAISSSATPVNVAGSVGVIPHTCEPPLRKRSARRSGALRKQKPRHLGPGLYWMSVTTCVLVYALSESAHRARRTPRLQRTERRGLASLPRQLTVGVF